MDDIHKSAWMESVARLCNVRSGPARAEAMPIEIQDTAALKKYKHVESVSHSDADMANPIGVMRR